ncbi:MAG: arginine repressor [Clostridia bacterium]|nr:arginine repressor [Clostridia bacterium]MBQ1375501.1 arginine repressor [Clostridia bacterium]MBQ1435796.1 arginine repressor [Clostridia bacterium]MBQ4248863.1 arginine repressor [Clostridia bacterium]
MKNKRQLKILELIDRYSVETQEELAERLKNEGFDVTQATISRDIKELRIFKVLDASGRYKYSSKTVETEDKIPKKLDAIFRECVVSIDCAGNMVVIKTLTGLASGAAAAIDSMNISQILGTLAGDDTIFIVFRTDEDAVRFSKEQAARLKE